MKLRRLLCSLGVGMCIVASGAGSQSASGEPEVAALAEVGFGGRAANQVVDIVAFPDSARMASLRPGEVVGEIKIGEAVSGAAGKVVIGDRSIFSKRIDLLALMGVWI